MTALPSPNGSNGRATGGRFAAGNSGGPGNPHAKRVAQVRSLVLDTVTDEDMRLILSGLVERAKAGDPIATREVLDRLIGKPVQSIALDAHLGLNATPADSENATHGPQLTTRSLRLYIQLQVPRQNWSPMVNEPYQRWLADELHPDRPKDFPELVAQVQHNCEGWTREPQLKRFTE